MAMMGGGMGMRTIWITLRAVNYTQRIFDQVIRQMRELEMVEKDFGKVQLQNLRIGNAMIMTGMMLSSVGQMMIQNLWQLAMTTEKGATEMARLQQEIDAVKIAFADTLYDILKTTHILDILHGVLAAIRSNKALQWIVTILIGLASIALLVGGGVIFLTGALNSFMALTTLLPAVLEYFRVQLLYTRYSMDMAATSGRGLAVALGMALGAFTLFMLIGDVIGPVAGTIVAALAAITLAVLALAVSLNILSLGFLTGQQLGALAAGAGLAAGVMAIQAGGGFAGGTRGVARTGPAMVHAGEIIYNPATHRPTQVGNDLERGLGEGGGRGTSFYDIPITIENLHTKTDIDDVDEELGKVWRRKMRNSR